MGNPGQYKGYYDLGFRMLGCGSDSVFVRKGALNMVSEMNDRNAKSQIVSQMIIHISMSLLGW